MRSKRFAVAVSVVCVLAAACSSNGSTNGGPSMVSPGKVLVVSVPLESGGPVHSEKSASTAPGSVVRLELGSNPTTGYNWKMTSPPDSTYVKSEGSTMEPPASSMPGAAGTQVFTFTGLAPGTTKAIFTYARPFGNGKPAKVLTLTLEVK